MRIFISYALEDQAAVEALNADLERARFEVWMDEELIGGESWWDTILEQIRSCELYIFALSPNSVRSRACKAELDYAIALSRPLLAVKVQEVAIQLAHPAIARTQMVDYRKRSMESLLALMAVVANQPPAPPLPDPLPAAPTTPMSYMNEFRKFVEALSFLTYEQQRHLLSDLEGYLDRGEERDIALQLVRGLRQRRDISTSIAREIDQLPEFANEEDPKAAPEPMAVQSSGAPKPAAIVDENVQFTVYRPNAVQPEVWYPLLAFAHLAERRPDAPPGQPDPLEQVQTGGTGPRRQAGYGAPRVDARGGVPREGQLTFVPFVEGVDFNPRSQTFEWQEDVHQQNFRLKARPDTAGRVLRGQLTVYLGAFILADIDLTFRVDLAAPPPPTPTVRPVTLLATSSASPTSPQPELTPVTAVPYQKVFPSYSHKDLAIVRQAEAYGKALGHIYLRDRLALRSGEEWEQRLLELIDEADIFQLFWSSNSMRSEYVRREWEHALALGRRAFIRPTYWEVPMPHSANPHLPPDELAKLHFHGFFEESDGGEPGVPNSTEAPPTAEAADVARPREAVAGQLGRQEPPPSDAPPESRSPPTAPSTDLRLADVGERRQAARCADPCGGCCGCRNPRAVPAVISPSVQARAPTSAEPSSSGSRSVRVQRA